MKRLIAILLFLALGIGLLVGCQPAEKESTDPNLSNTSDESQEESGDGRFVADVPYKDYGQKVIKILTTGTRVDRKTAEFEFNEEYEESTVNLAVEERNNKVEELLGIKIVEEFIVDGNRFAGGILKERVELAMNANADDFHIAVPSLYNCGALASSGAIYDLTKFEHLHNFTAPWWDQTFIEDLNIEGKTFFITGDVSIETRNSITVCYFNKNMFRNNDLDDPYQLVRDKKWTFDKLIQLSKEISQDLNDDDIIDYQDIFGLGGQLDLAWAMFYGAGERIASKGSDGYPTLTMYNARSVGVLDKMLELMTNDDYFVSANRFFNVSPTPVSLITEAFLADRALLFASVIGNVENLREMSADNEFGILPIPLFDEEQENYQHMVNPWSGNAICIPSYLSLEEAEIVSIVLEVLGAESKNYITPAYYERALKKQSMHDEDSQEMLDIIFSAVGADMGHVYDWGKLGKNILHDSVEQKLVGQFQSTYQKYEDVAKDALDKTVDAFKELN